MGIFKIYFEWIIGVVALLAVFGLINGGDISSAIESHINEKTTLAQVTIKNQDAYMSQESKYTSILYKEDTSKYKDMIERMAELYLPLLMQDFSCTLDQKAKLVLYSTKKEMASALKLSVKDVPMGAYSSGVLSILSPELWIDSDDELVIRERFMDDGPVVHELVHLVLDKKVDGKYPLWFTEGVALYYEYKYLNYEWRKDLAGTLDNVTLADLENSFKSLESGPAYRKSFEIVKEIVDTYGEKQLQNLIVELKQDGNFKLAFDRAFETEPKW